MFGWWFVCVFVFVWLWVCLDWVIIDLLLFCWVCLFVAWVFVVGWICWFGVCVCCWFLGFYGFMVIVFCWFCGLFVACDLRGLGFV